RRFLDHAQFDRVLGRIQIETDDVDELLAEVRVGRDLERVFEVRIDSQYRLDVLDGVFRYSDLSAHREHRPVVCPGGVVFVVFSTMTASSIERLRLQSGLTLPNPANPSAT